MEQPLENLDLISNLRLQWTPMGSNERKLNLFFCSSTISNSNGLLWAPMEETSCSHYSFAHLESPTPMDSNGLQWKKLLVYTIISLIYNLQLPWTPMGSNGRTFLFRLFFCLSTISNSNGLQWNPMEETFCSHYCFAHI